MFSQLTPPFIIAMLLALSLHEMAHGLVAYWLGDPTAKYEGRLTLNPLAHLDPIGTLLFLTIGFGWGKPVPVNPRYFKKHKRDTALVSIAGPVSNLLLAFLFGFILWILLTVAGAEAININPFLRFLVEICSASISLNIGLMAFNLLPIAPLDGSKILQAFIPLKYEDQYENFMRNGPYILLILLVAQRIVGLDILGTWIELIAHPVFVLFRLLFGGL